VTSAAGRRTQAGCDGPPAGGHDCLKAAALLDTHHWSSEMKTPYRHAFALVLALGQTGTVGLAGPTAFSQLADETASRQQTSQYCVPKEEEDQGAPRIYC
jgi:hypothetical protein